MHCNSINGVIRGIERDPGHLYQGYTYNNHSIIIPLRRYANDFFFLLPGFFCSPGNPRKNWNRFYMVLCRTPIWDSSCAYFSATNKLIFHNIPGNLELNWFNNINNIIKLCNTYIYETLYYFNIINFLFCRNMYLHYQVFHNTILYEITRKAMLK